MLTKNDFAEFYQQVHHRPCFSWQQDLAARVLERGWPGLVDVPTGLGKTTLLDIAVFVAAATVHVPGAERIGRRRTLFVVDRRIVVDEASEYAQDLADALADAEHEGSPAVVSQVAAGLRAYAPDTGGELLAVTTMRGGTTWEDAWLDRPDRPGIVLGTVDQVGSRLLFRGYGVSERRRPIDAALVGTDALLLVDEAHLATALTRTVAAARERDHRGLPLPGLDVVQLSATGRDPGDTFALDVDAHRGDPVAWQRLTAAKELFCVETTPKNCDRTMADTALRLLSAHADGGTAPTALIVCNTVDRARAVHAVLARAVSSGAHSIEPPDLLIGRSRPLDREGLQEHVLGRFGAGREGRSTRSAVLVATQTVEVGVNLDVDVLVTESASWNAIVQRLGRLNRLGSYVDRFPGHTAAPAVVVHDGQADGPVYGTDRDRVWERLVRLAPPGDGTAPDGGFPGLDVSPLRCRSLTEDIGQGAQDAPEPPVLLTPILDAWVRTAPAPANDPPIQAFLHGFDTGRPAVSLAWRDGLLAEPDPMDLADDDGAELHDTVADQLLTAVPVRSAEQVEVPFVAVRQWMSGQTAPAFGDIESGADPDEGKPRQEREPFRVLAWRLDPSGDETSGFVRRWRWIEHGQLRPGDSVVVPAERGGLDRYGWNPTGRAPVLDVGDAVTFVRGHRRRQATLRVDRGLADRLGLDGDARSRVLETLSGLRSSGNRDLSPVERAQQVAGMLRDVLSRSPAEAEKTELGAEPATERDGIRANLLRWLGSRPELVEVIDSRGGVLADQKPDVLTYLLTGHLPAADDAENPEIAQTWDGTSLDVVRDDDDPVASSISRQQITLDEHLDKVSVRAGQIARALNLPPDLVDVVSDAARWHDLGKHEERFQAMLHGGDLAAAAVATDVLAKSGMDPADRVGWIRARQRSQLPAGARHEAWSATLVTAYLQDRLTPYPGDEDLLVHLVASHHGHSRPLLPLVGDPHPRPITAALNGVPISVSSETTVLLDGPSRFARLNDRYGRWGLALLETVVRCADMTVSAEGS